MEGKQTVWEKVPWQAVVVAVLGVAGVFALKPGLDTSRPAALVTNTNAVIGGEQDIDARLWQDPLGATAESLDREWAKRTPPRRRLLGRDVRKLFRDGSDRTLVLAVMLPAGPYSENAETRLRARQAIASGLGRVRFVPEDDEHLGVCRLPSWPPRRPQRSTLLPAARLLDSSAVEPAGLATRQAAADDLCVPFERWRYQGTFVPVDKVQDVATKYDSVLVLWLPEEAFAHDPAFRLETVLDRMLGTDDDLLVGKRGLVLLGPYSSAMLREFCQDAVRDGDRPYDNPWLARADLITATASADWQTLDYDAKLGPIDAVLTKNKFVGSFRRSTATDDHLCDALVAELDRRGVNPRSDPIALVSEWDTFYGRELPLAFERAAGGLPSYGKLVVPRTVPTTVPAAGTPATNILNYSYLRGLDGLLPADGNAARLPDHTGVGDPAGTAAEVVEGHDQRDYLRRMADELVKVDRGFRARQSHGYGLRAVGILGSDLYDKLLILKVLRDRLPGTLFFTTDLDARLSLPNEVTETRGLLVAATYGLRLDPAYQGEISPFRDSYQTSYFLATMAAVGQAELPKTEAIDAGVRLFQIGRTRAVDISLADVALHPRRVDDWAWVVRGVNVWAVTALAAAGAAGLLVAVAVAGVGRTRGLCRRVACHWSFSAAIAVALAAILTTLAADFAGKAGEPFYLFEGVSIWTTEAIRLSLALVSFYLLFRIRFVLKNNARQIEAKFHLSPSAADPTISEAKRWKAWKADAYPFDPKEVCPTQRAGEVWRRYRRGAERSRRLFRMSLVALVYLLIVGAALFVFGFPDLPIRGSTSRFADAAIQSLTVGLIGLLALYAGDVAWLFQRLVRHLQSHEVVWPVRQGQSTPGVTGSPAFYWELVPATGGATEPAAATASSDRAADAGTVDPRLRGLVTAVQVLAARSASITWLVYLPSAAIALSLVARSRLFDDWDWPPSVIVATSLAFAFSVGCHWSMLGTAARFKVWVLDELEKARPRRGRAEQLPGVVHDLVRFLADLRRRESSRRRSTLDRREPVAVDRLIDVVRRENRGAFARFAVSPTFLAFVIPVAVAVLDHVAHTKP